MRFERSGGEQEPSRGHKFSILENVVLHRDFTSATLASFDVILLGRTCPKPCWNEYGKLEFTLINIFQTLYDYQSGLL